MTNVLLLFRQRNIPYRVKNNNRAITGPICDTVSKDGDVLSNLYRMNWDTKYANVLD